MHKPSTPPKEPSVSPVKPLPFAISREKRGPLTDQLTRGLHRAIRSGYYAPGAQLPTIVEIAEALAVSTIVVRHAVRRLAEMGLLVARPRSGIRVQAGGTPNLWRAHVLQLARATSSSYYFAVRDQVFQEHLRASRVRVSVVLVGAQERESGFAGIRSAIESDPVQLAILEGPSWGEITVLERERVPFVHLFITQPSAKAAGTLTLEDDSALREMVRHATRCGVRTMLGVFSGGGEPATRFEEAVGAARLACEILLAQPDFSRPNPENVEAAGLAAVGGYLRRAAALPGLIYFGDDFLGRGGLMALACAGRRVPEDVQVITHSNRGNRVAYPKTLTRVEADPVEAGAAVAALVTRVLGKPRRRPEITLAGRRLIVGETTRLKAGSAGTRRKADEQGRTS
jgi:DNA-binding LacI/PurR family transcriptional regulator